MAKWKWECQTCQKSRACPENGLCFPCLDDECNYEPFKNFATTSTKYEPSKRDYYTSNSTEHKINGLDKYKCEPLNMDLGTDITKITNDYISAMKMSFSEKKKLKEQYLAWCEEQNKEIKGGKLDKNSFINVISFLESIGWSNVKENKTEMSDNVNHPSHYGGEDNPYEAIKIIEAWNLGFCLGNAVKYISRAGKKDKSKTAEDLEKAVWYLQREIDRLKGENK